MRGGNETPQQVGVGGEKNAPMSLGGGDDVALPAMFGGDTLTGVPIAGGSTSGQQYGANAVIQRGGNMGRVIVPAALVLANNMMGRGRSLRYKGKGAFRGKSSRYSRARYSRRRASRRSRR